MSKLTINFLPNKTYPKLRRVFSDYHGVSIIDGRTVGKKKPLIAKDFPTSVGLSVFTNKFNFIATSDTSSINDIKRFLPKKLYEMQEENKDKAVDTKAVIYGGIAYDINNPDSEISCKTVDLIEEACVQEGIEPVVITGQYDNNLKATFDTYTGHDQMIFWGNLVDKIKLTKDATQEEIVKTLENLFEYVKIPEDVAVKVIEGLKGFYSGKLSK